MSSEEASINSLREGNEKKLRLLAFGDSNYNDADISLMSAPIGSGTRTRDLKK